MPFEYPTALALLPECIATIAQPVVILVPRMTHRLPALMPPASETRVRSNPLPPREVCDLHERLRESHQPMFQRIRKWLRRRRYRVGRTLSRFIAKDVRREVHTFDVSRLDEGYITARVRTTNVLYVIRGLIEQPGFEEPREIALKELWRWTGKPWGGLPDGTSIVDRD